MADIFSKKKRSEVMASIKNKGNRSTELKFIGLLRKYKIAGWRRGNLSLPGKPDFIFPERKKAIFIDGCFWHGCSRCRSIPNTNREFWSKKISRNVLRDKKVRRQLKAAGWNVMRIWEHQLKKSLETLAEKV